MSDILKAAKRLEKAAERRVKARQEYEDAYAELKGALRIAHPLSPRQNQVWKLIQEGKCNKEIAEDLKIAVRTVKFHVSKLLESTGCKSRHDLDVFGTDFVANGRIS